jgi:hypothetical protein
MSPIRPSPLLRRSCVAPVRPSACSGRNLNTPLPYCSVSPLPSSASLRRLLVYSLRLFRLVCPRNCWSAGLTLRVQSGAWRPPWSLGSSLVETLFDAGRRQAVTEQAQASYDATVATYRQTVLGVEDNLAILRILEAEAAQQEKAVQTAEAALNLAINRYKGGITTYLEVITAQSAALTAERTALDLSTRRMNASVLLIKALGGGWGAASM